MSNATSHPYHVSRAAGLPPFFELLVPPFLSGGVDAAVVENRPGVVARFVARVRRNLEARRTVAMLSQLDNRVLDDIGIERGDIHTVAAAAAAEQFKATHVLRA